MEVRKRLGRDAFGEGPASGQDSEQKRHQAEPLEASRPRLRSPQCGPGGRCPPTGVRHIQGGGPANANACDPGFPALCCWMVILPTDTGAERVHSQRGFYVPSFSTCLRNPNMCQALFYALGTE